MHNDTSSTTLNPGHPLDASVVVVVTLARRVQAAW
jgi:hypothetical protein